MGVRVNAFAAGAAGMLREMLAKHTRCFHKYRGAFSVDRNPNSVEWWFIF
jgi:hypothetical protein